MIADGLHAPQAIFKNVLGKTQAEVKAKLKQAITDAGGLNIAKADEHTVASWLSLWYEVYAKPNIRTVPTNRYELMITKYVAPRIGNIKLKS